MKRRTILVAICFALIASSVFGANLTATIREISGKVESRTPTGEWTPVKVGDVLNAGDSISTGFNSKAVMVLGDTSVLVAKDLTRLTLTELYKKKDTVVTDLFLDIGNIRSEVHSSDSVANDFKVRSANTTASVRGTVLDVEIMGDGRDIKAMAWDGTAKVEFNKTGAATYVGEQKRKNSNNEVAKEVVEKEEVAIEDDADTEASKEESSNIVAAELGSPSEPPPSIEASPVIAIGNGQGMVSSLTSTISASTVTVSTIAPSPTEVAVGGGSYVSTEPSSIIGDALYTNSSVIRPKPTTTNVSIR